MQTFIIILVVSWIVPILFALVNIYRKIGKGSTIKSLFSRLQWPVCIPVFNIIVLVMFIVMSVGDWFLNIRVK